MNTFSDTTFIIDEYDFDIETGAIALRYQLGDHRFEERYRVPVDTAAWSKVSEADLTQALFALHIICGISYWKARCSKEIVVRSGELTQEQADYWNHLYTVGMGEFHYKNQIDFTGEAPFSATIDTFPEPHGSNIPSTDVLVPLGGGKDSVVTAELLKAAGKDIALFTSEDAPPIKATSEILDAPRLLATRTFDKSLKNVPDAYNGHIPISAIWSHLSVVVALLHDKRDVVFSWEASASEGSLEYLGIDVNHQYSKSLDFEQRLGSYLSRFVTKRVRIFSILRPWTEFRIMRAFAHLPAYHQVFSSCNKNFTQASLAANKQTFWCNECPKCAFVFALLVAWLPHADVVGIFGDDLFSREDLLDLFKELLGVSGNKPFECVGEAQEVAAALEMVLERGDALETPVMQLYTGEVRSMFNDPQETIKNLLELRKEHAVPEDYLPIAQSDLI